MKNNISKLILVIIVVAMIFVVAIMIKDFKNTENKPDNNNQKRNQTIDQLALENANLELGNPSNAINDVSSQDNFLIVKPQYTLSYNNSKHIPNWVSWHSDSSDIGSVKRKDDFRADTQIPSQWYKVIPSDYLNSGFDKGHMCPSADRTSNTTNNSATFLMINMVPQAPKNNEITWEHLESYARKLISNGNEVYNISGTYGKGGTGANGYMESIGNGITVPSKIWKIIVVLQNGENDISRISSTTRVISVVTPNDQTCSDHPWDYYRVSVDFIESLTGYDFLSNVPERVQRAIEAKVDDGPVQ